MAEKKTRGELLLALLLLERLSTMEIASLEMTDDLEEMIDYIGEEVGDNEIVLDFLKEFFGEIVEESRSISN